jgi:hypothetical protein
MTHPSPDCLAVALPEGPHDLPQGALALKARAAIRDACLCLAQGARRELLIFSRDLDPDLYDQSPFLAELQRIALATTHQPVRALVREPRVPAMAGHRLVELARQLSSRIAIRRVGDDFRDRLDAFLIVDARGYCLRRLADQPEAVVEYAAPAQARRLRAEYEEIWERSDADIELRRLHI